MLRILAGRIAVSSKHVRWVSQGIPHESEPFGLENRAIAHEIDPCYLPSVFIAADNSLPLPPGGGLSKTQRPGGIVKNPNDPEDSISTSQETKLMQMIKRK